MEERNPTTMCADIIDNVRDYTKEKVSRILHKLDSSYYYYAFFGFWFARYDNSFKNMHEPFVVFDILHKMPLKMHYCKLARFIDFLEEEGIIVVQKTKTKDSKNKQKQKLIITLTDEKTFQAVMSHPDMETIKQNHLIKNEEKKYKPIKKIKKKNHDKEKDVKL